MARSRSCCASPIDPGYTARADRLGDDDQSHRHDAVIDHVERARSGGAHVEDAARSVGAPVVHPHHGAPVVAEVLDEEPGAEAEAAVGGGVGAAAIALAGCGG